MKIESDTFTSIFSGSIVSLRLLASGETREISVSISISDSLPSGDYAGWFGAEVTVRAKPGESNNRSVPGRVKLKNGKVASDTIPPAAPPGQVDTASRTQSQKV